MKISTVIILLITINFQSLAQFQLSEEASVSIVYQGPNQAYVYTAFGHVGFRIKDPKRNVDWFFNYGVYDFEQENFYLNFAQGLLKYKVSYYDFKYVIKTANKYTYYLKEQVLNLDQDQKQQFLNFLYHNAKPENAEYLYNYVYDNCATKIADISNELFPNQITYDYSFKEDKTIRELMDEYLKYQLWGDFGIDLGLGMQIDKEATAEEYLFLPEYVMKAFEGATIKRDSIERPLVSKTVELIPQREESNVSSVWTPFNIFLIMFFVAGLITNRNYKSGKRTRWIDNLLFGLAGFGGLWVAYLWLGTEHLSKWNLNILWAIPFHLPILFLIGKERFRPFVKNYFGIVAVLYSLLLLSWGFLPQPLPTALVPYVLAMVLRAFYIRYDLRKAYIK